MPALRTSPTPVIDVFAGPGGLCEGFSSFRPNDKPAFKTALSIEMDAQAHQTLTLRAFFRQFDKADRPEAYYEYLRGEQSLEKLYTDYPEQYRHARDECWQAELGNASSAPIDKVRRQIKSALAESRNWVLIGGPPCQPFSLAGRSRNKTGTQHSGEGEKRHTLYQEYLQIIADFWPAVFVMENVRGLLSAKFDGKRIFDTILEDLKDPAAAIASLPKRGRRQVDHDPHTYTLHALGPSEQLFETSKAAQNYIIQCEDHDVPQARHRLILVGVRNDLKGKPGLLAHVDRVPARKVFAGLPRLRGGLSKQDTTNAYREVLASALESDWLNRINAVDKELYRLIEECIFDREPPAERGGNYVSDEVTIKHRPDWYLDPRLGGVCNHQARGHMPSDLHRYLFAAAFALHEGRSPALADFPAELLPDHKNVRDDKDFKKFADRFRVQRADSPSTTVVSHIAKDGHYYIHPDPYQCRSLTVREAARLQTFPDNYFFTGNRTQQYHQVGNAVPPLLAYQIAEIVHDLLKRSGLA